MITEVALTKRLVAHVEQQAGLPMKPETAVYIVRVLSRKILSIVKEEVAEDRRARKGKEIQS